MAVLQESSGVTSTDVNIMVVRPRPQTKLLQLTGVLMLFGLALLLRLLILEAAVVKELADRRHRVRRDLDQIEITLPRHLQGLGGRHDAKLLSVLVDEADFRDSNGAIDARAGWRPLWHVTGLDAKGPPLMNLLSIVGKSCYKASLDPGETSKKSPKWPNPTAKWAPASPEI